MAENSVADWILINLKFRGKCIGCGKEITSGRACFICGKAEPEEDEDDINEYPYLKEIKSQSYICKSCLQREDAFEAYREDFLQKIKRYMK